MNIAMIIAPEGFQDHEFNIPKEYFSSKGAMIDVYSTQKGIAKGKLGSRINIEKTLDMLDVDNYTAIVFIGGPGTPLVREDPKSIRIAKQASEKGKIVAAICWSPTILAQAGILKDKKSTVWEGMDDEFDMLTSEYLEEQGASYTGQSVTVDGNIVTANGPSAAKAFAEAVMDSIITNERLHNIRAA